MSTARSPLARTSYLYLCPQPMDQLQGSSSEPQALNPKLRTKSFTAKTPQLNRCVSAQNDVSSSHRGEGCIGLGIFWHVMPNEPQPCETSNAHTLPYTLTLCPNMQHAPAAASCERYAKACFERVKQRGLSNYSIFIPILWYIILCYSILLYLD